ncbi:MAG: arginase [Elusimicrobia bacterium]|nr:arginase [Elusimicrobiota bacterium]
MTKTRHATVIGVPLDYGASKRGASGGPAAVRRANLVELLEALGLDVSDAGDLPVPKVAPAAKGKLKNGAAILKVCRELESQCYEAVANGSTPITLGGDHSLAVGSVSGVARAFRDKGRKVGLIWVDAHADINTPETSPTGNVHGMPLAHLLGMGHKDFARLGGFSPKVDPRNVVLVGIRDVDRAEAVNIRKSGIRVFSMQEIDRYGMGVVTEQAIDMASDGTAGFHVSFDIDCVDPGNAPGTGTIKRGGLTYRESHLFMELAADSERALGLDLAEVNPLEDTQNATAVLAAELIASAMGKNIY